LTSLSLRKIKFEWHSSHQQAFDKIKKVMATAVNVPLWYSDFCNHFYLYADKSDHPLPIVNKPDKVMRKKQKSSSEYTKSSMLCSDHMNQKTTIKILNIIHLNAFINKLYVLLEVSIKQGFKHQWYSVNLRIAEIWFTILPSKQIGINSKQKSEHYPRIKSQIPHEYNVGN
jgi:hypothetical protein